MAGIFGSGQKNNQPIRYQQLNIQTSAQGVCIPIVYGQNRIGTNILSTFNFRSTPVKQSAGKGGAKASTTYSYSTGVVMGLCEGPIIGVPQVWEGQAYTTVANIGLTLYLGTATQTAPGYITSNYPAKAQSYANTAYVYSSSLYLGDSPDIPNHGYEVQGFFWNSQYSAAGGIPDVNPADFTLDYLTATRYGVGLSIYTAGDMTNWRNYCQAQGFFMSPALTSAEQVVNTIQRWAQLTNSWIFWSADRIKYVPLGDSVITGNGATYTPQMAPIYDLTIDDFVYDANTPPIIFTRSDPADGYNNVQLNINDRSNYYNSTPVYWFDQLSEDLYGTLPANEIQASEVCIQSIAQVMAQLIGQRACYIRNTYQFKTGYNFVLLEPGDIVTLTDTNIGLNKFPVRITGVTEDVNGNLAFKAEELPTSIGTATIYPTASNVSGGPLPFDASPGGINPPCIFEPLSTLTGNVGEVWIQASGGVNWGGCDVWLSFDNVTFGVKVGSIASPALQGVLYANISTNLTDNLYVDLTESSGIMPTTATTADAAAGRTLILVDNEIMCYGGVSLGGTSEQFELQSLLRGQYGTAIASHIVPTAFTTTGSSAINSSILYVPTAGLSQGMSVSGSSSISPGAQILTVGSGQITLNTPLTGNVANGASITIGSCFTRIDQSINLVYDLPQQYVGQTVYLKFTSVNLFNNQEQSLSSVPAYAYTPTGASIGGEIISTHVEIPSPVEGLVFGKITVTPLGRLTVDAGASVTVV